MNEIAKLTHAFTTRQLTGFAAGLLALGVALGMVLGVALFAIALTV